MSGGTTGKVFDILRGVGPTACHKYGYLVPRVYKSLLPAVRAATPLTLRHLRLIVTFVLFCRHFHFALPAACSDDATMPPLMLLLLWLIVTFFLFSPPLPLCAACCLQRRCHHATTLPHLLFSFLPPLPSFALPAACCNDVAWQLPPRHHSCSRSSG